MLTDNLNNDLKQAMLARDTEKVQILRGLKSAVLYEEVAKGKRDSGLSEEEVIAVFRKEAKKRQDSIALYEQGGNKEMAEKESVEKSTIESYLPAQLDAEDTDKLITDVLKDLSIDSPEQKDMGRIIGAIKSKGAEVDSSLVAKLVKERIAS